MASQVQSEGQEAGAAIDPMHQFEVHSLYDLPTIMGVDTSFTNSSLWMVLSVGSIIILMSLMARSTSIVPGRMQ